MGADVTWIDTERNNTYYFRDSYNDSNLAHVIGLSYWTNGDVYELNIVPVDDTVELEIRKDMFRKMAKITDSQIRQFARNKCTGERLKELIAFFKSKRDDIKKHMKMIEAADDVLWSV